VPGATEKVKARTVRTRDDIAVSRAVELVGFHQYDAAAQILETVLGSAPEHDEARAWLLLVRARKYKAAGQDESAHDAYRALLELNPEHDEARAESERLTPMHKKSLWSRMLKLGG